MPRISEVIKKLKEMKAEYGDLEVYSHSFGGVGEYHLGRIKKENLKKIEGRESKLRFTYKKDQPIEKIVLAI